MDEGAYQRKAFGAERGRLVGLFQVGTSNSSTLPPWLIGDAVEVVGAGVALEAIRNARERDMRPGADGYYDAFAAEALWRQGKDVDALARVRSALEELP